MENYLQDGIFLYRKNNENNELTIIGVDNPAGSIIEFPEKINNMRVARIQFDYALQRLYPLEDVFEEIVIGNHITLASQCFAFWQVKKVTIGDNVVLEDSVFQHCQSLETVIFNGRITLKNDSVFSFCSALISIVIPEGVTMIPPFTFADCFSLCHIQLPLTLESIGAASFSGCRSLPVITIPDNVILIGEAAFESCRNLAIIEMPRRLKYIVNNPFKNSSNVEKICVPLDVTHIDGSDRQVPVTSNFYILGGGYSDFDADNFYSKKTWKQIFKGKMGKAITTEKESKNQLLKRIAEKEVEIRAKQSTLKLENRVDDIVEYLLQTNKRKDILPLKKILLAFIDKMTQQVTKVEIENEVEKLVPFINDFDKNISGLETEEREGLLLLIHEGALLANYPFPENDEYYDITEKWRDLW